MTVSKIFTTDKEADLWIKMNSEKLEELEFTKLNLKNFGTLILYKTKNLKDENQMMQEIFRSIPPNIIRDGIPCYEGSANEIARDLDLPAKMVLSNLREMRDTNVKWVKYSRTSDIEPKVKTGGVCYWRIELKDHKSKVVKPAKLGKLTFNKR